MVAEELFASVLDDEPLLYKGATTSEIIMLLKIFPPITAVLGFFIGLLIGGLKMGILFAILFATFLTMLAIWIVASLFVNLKLGKPEGYVLQWVAIKFHEYLGFKTGFIYKLASWGDFRK